MGELVVIMEICPCPGYLEPLHGCHLQQAEYHVLAKRGWKFYHEHAVKIGEWPNPVLAYRRIDAELLLGCAWRLLRKVVLKWLNFIL
jgi:hypothetical protein